MVGAWCAAPIFRPAMRIVGGALMGTVIIGMPIPEQPTLDQPAPMCSLEHPGRMGVPYSIARVLRWVRGFPGTAAGLAGGARACDRMKTVSSEPGARC
jgi:hypothetical protein